MFNKLKRYSIKNMYVVHVGNLMEQRSVDEFIPHFLTIASLKNLKPVTRTLSQKVVSFKN